MRSGSAYLLLGVTVFLMLAGLLAIYSASSVADYVKLGDSAHHLKRQLIFMAMGLATLFIASRVRLRQGKTRGGVLQSPATVGWAVWIASVIGMLAVPFVGVEINGAKRWLDAGLFNIQPSEFAKLGCVILVAVFLTQWQSGKLTARELTGRLALVTLPVFALVMLQPDMGTTMSIAIAVFFLLWLGGVRLSALGGIAGVGGALVAILIVVAPYRMQRYVAFLDPWKDPKGDGFQIIQSLYAFGSGGLAGIGLGMSRQKFFYLPAAHTDFIFAIIGEELGLIGALTIVAAFVLMAYAGIRIALQAGNRFDRLLAGGLTAMIVTQAAMNVAAVTGAMPVTGIPLPLVSYGGSSMMFTLACVGLVLGVARRSMRSQDRARSTVPVALPPVRDAGRERPVASTSRWTGQTTRGSERAVSSERRRDGGARLPGADGGRPARRRRA
jgi:cell division protein FtsW